LLFFSGAGDQGVFGLDEFAMKFAEEVAVPESR
jgi:hypothetical protein